ncbi:hypothetical protein F2Q68_00032245 [Brassica cretica]|uniref:Uncharacterized protein n=1 Tax=Brassica cretica TaxID=69181 RepID=A0A8S9GHQ6_BRACR|nr:hypothetical protein F2Q68_00032245 [Brassica cretica]
MIAAGDVSVASCEIVLLLSFEVSTSSVGAVSTGGVKLSDKFVERSGVNSAPVSISEVGLVLFVSGSGDACSARTESDDAGGTEPRPSSLGGESSTIFSEEVVKGSVSIRGYVSGKGNTTSVSMTGAEDGVTSGKSIGKVGKSVAVSMSEAKSILSRTRVSGA